MEATPKTSILESATEIFLEGIVNSAPSYYRSKSTIPFSVNSYGLSNREGEIRYATVLDDLGEGYNKLYGELIKKVLHVGVMIKPHPLGITISNPDDSDTDLINIGDTLPIVRGDRIRVYIPLDDELWGSKNRIYEAHDSNYYILHPYFIESLDEKGDVKARYFVDPYSF